ncbi:MAG: SNF2-related protein, partial [Ginsengibacter sp.]
MALPYFIKYIYNSGTDEVIRRGKKIYSQHFVELAAHDELMHSVVFRVRDDSYNTFYKVQIEKYDDPKTFSVRCTCPYNISDICRHEAAALMQLQDLIDKNLLDSSKGAPVYNQKHTVVKIKYIDLKMIRMLTGMENYTAAEEILRKNKCNIIEAANEKVEAVLENDDQTFHIILQKNEERNFDTSCTCDEGDHQLCKHKTALFLQLLNNWGPYYFDSIRKWDKEQNKLLQGYGYSLEDDLSGKFEFIYKDGKPFLKVIDPSIRRITPSTPVRIGTPVETAVMEEEVKIISGKNKQITLVFNGNEKSFPFVSIDVVQGDYDEQENKFIGRIEKLDLSKFININDFNDKDKQLIQQARKLQPSEINKYLNRNSPFSGFWENIIHDENEELPQETKMLMAEFIHPKLKRIFEENQNKPVFYLPPGKNFTTQNLQSIDLSSEKPLIEFSISTSGGEKLMEALVNLDQEKVKLSDNQWNSDLLFLHDKTFYLWERSEHILLVEKFKNTLHIPNNEWPSFLKEVAIPLSNDYAVSFAPSLIKETKEGQPDISVMLIEKGDYLMFQPVFTYKGFSVKASDKDTIIVPDNDRILIVKRNKEAEQQFISKLGSLHSQFINQPQNKSLVLKGADVLKNNWFFLFVDAMKEMKVPVYGFEALKNFRFNTAKPSTHIHLSSGMDWFDARVELAFGEQHIGIAEIQKALANKQSFVQLNDGTLGILPDEWIKKYALLFKVGEGKNNRLRLSRFHLSVIDDLYDQRDEQELSFELDEKYERLRNYKSIPEVPIPEQLESRLRPYQLSGFHWLNYLNTVGWGGILADDMGLGKTVQALSMLQHFAEEEGGLKALVVCPTTLIYNWENEIRKFTPSLTWRIHHGNARAKSKEDFSDENIIITTYGTLRSDIQMLMKIPFDYVVLDESQAIKNPASKVTKAAGLLKVRNRICMSGTPLQ